MKHAACIHIITQSHTESTSPQFCSFDVIEVKLKLVALKLVALIIPAVLLCILATGSVDVGLRTGESRSQLVRVGRELLLKF